MESKVNYNELANRYDRNPIRNRIDPEAFPLSVATDLYRILDVGCGTGTFIESQVKYYPQKRFQWFGIDPSSGMLANAREKVPSASWIHASAERLPFNDHFFDYVTTRFTHHHFTDLTMAVLQIFRVLKPDGCFRMLNIAPDLSPEWWLFKYFPTAKEFDRKRIRSIEQVSRILIEAGFFVEFSPQKMGPLPASWILNEIINRETSELVLMADDIYEAGLARAQKDLRVLGDRLVEPGLTFGVWKCAKI